MVADVLGLVSLINSTAVPVHILAYVHLLIIAHKSVHTEKYGNMQCAKSTQMV